MAATSPVVTTDEAMVAVPADAQGSVTPATAETGGENPDASASELPSIESPDAGEGNARSSTPSGSKSGNSKSSEDEKSESDAESSDSSEEGSEFEQRVSKLRTSRIHKAYAMRLENQKSKRKDEDRAPAMVRGIMDYMKMLEDRIQSLEATGTAKAVEKEGTDQQKETDEQGELGSLVHEVKFFHTKGEFAADGNWHDNTLKKGSYQSKLDPNHLIRVLYDWMDDSNPQNRNKETPEPEDIDVLSFGIMSQPVAAFFSKRLAIDMEEAAGHPVRFGKPFRPLIRNFQAVRDHLAKLERKHGSSDGADSGRLTPMKELRKNGGNEGSDADKPRESTPFPTASGEEGEPPAFETAEALIHFRYFVDFVEKYLKDLLDRFDRLRGGLAERVAFEDLWMLFSTGDTIYSPSVRGGVIFRDGDTTHTAKSRYSPQLFRVLGTKGGLPFRKIFGTSQAVLDDEVFESHTLSELLLPGMRQEVLTTRNLDVHSYRRNKTTYTSLHVLCFNIDFDGVRYGTVREFFLFKPFNGLMDIRGLEAYPVQYLKPQISRPLNAEEKKEDSDPLLERGKRFLNVTSVSHLSYEGLTVGQSREEINSAVIVDFKSSFQEYQHEFLNREDVVPNFTPISGLWPPEELGEAFEVYRTKCPHGWCHKLDCLRDPCYASQATQVEKIEREIKSVLEEHEDGSLRQGETSDWFKKYMEEKDLVRFLPGVVPGFALRNRKWVQLDIERLEPLQQGDNWDDLVLPSGHREMVQAMVETHTRGSRDSKRAVFDQRDTVSMDLVKGKGRGCIILLHGVPGVGKTSTAECVAAYTQRPLYPITSGDIGYLPEQVEKNMEKHFRLAHKWGCVLLLDEADVFLAKRNRTDVKRNGLVSVFLRILEYYSGILFLTTNRVGAIDDAFRSRLHLTLYYPKLTMKQTSKIWKNNLDRLKTINEDREAKQQPPIEFDKKKILRWVTVNNENLQWNGRQIRNAFQTAVALAEFEAKHEALAASSVKAKKKSGKSKSKTSEGPVMNVGHFRLIANASMQFNEYLHETLNNNEDEVAALDRVRAQSFTSRSKLKDIEEDSSSSSSSDSSSSSSSSGDEDDERSADDSVSGESSDESSDEESEKGKKKKKKKDKKSKAKASKKKKEAKK